MKYIWNLLIITHGEIEGKRDQHCIGFGILDFDRTIYLGHFI